MTTTSAPIPGSKAARSTIRPIGLVEQLLSKLFNPGQLQWLQELYNGSASKMSSAVQWGMDLLGLQKKSGEGGRLQRAEINSMQAATILQLNAHAGKDELEETWGGLAWQVLQSCLLKFVHAA